MFRHGELDIEGISSPYTILDDPARANLASYLRGDNIDLMAKGWRLTSQGRLTYPTGESNPNQNFANFPTLGQWQQSSSGGSTPAQPEPSNNPTTGSSNGGCVGLLLVLVFLGCAAFLANGGKIPGSPNPTPTAALQKAVAPVSVSSAAQQCNIETRITRNQRVYVCNAKSQAVILQAPLTSANVVYRPQLNERLTVVEGPSCPDGANWWRVKTQTNVIGWVDEGSEVAGYSICPFD